MNEPQTKAEFEARLQTAYGRLEALLAALTEEQAGAPGAVNAWSIRDLVVHLIYWQDFLARQIEAVLAGAPVPPSGAQSPQDTDRLNRQAVEASRAQPWPAVHRAFQDSVQRVQTVLAQLSDEDLFRSDRFRAVEAVPLWRSLASETYEHYEEHTPAVATWLGSRPQIR